MSFLRLQMLGEGIPSNRPHRERNSSRVLNAIAASPFSIGLCDLSVCLSNAFHGFYMPGAAF